jgi:hypothetical protein
VKSILPESPRKHHSTPSVRTRPIAQANTANTHDRKRDRGGWVAESRANSDSWVVVVVDKIGAAASKRCGVKTRCK